MKKALILFSSPHAAGHTRGLLEAFQSGLVPERWELQEMDVCREPIKPCMACGVCRIKEGCVFHDLDTFDGALRESDLLVIAAPVYNLSFPAQLKNVLDRFQRYFEARFALGIRPVIQKPRKAVLLLTMGKGDPFAVEVCEKTLRQSFSVMNTKLVGTLCLANTDAGTEEDDPIFEKARTMAIEIDREL